MLKQIENVRNENRYRQYQTYAITQVILSSVNYCNC